jgi:hypothetical protein
VASNRVTKSRSSSDGISSPPSPRKQRIFISWSGERSRAVAEALYAWLPNVIQAGELWMSEADIEKGARWSIELALHLNETRLGIICLTPENHDAPWILFEAGALSKTLMNTFVCPYLFDIQPADIKGPLAQFQLTRAQKEDTRKLVHTINRSLDVLALPEKQLDTIFDVWWPYLEKHLASIPAPQDKPRPRRLERDILEEVLETVRELTRVLPSKLSDSILCLPSGEDLPYLSSHVESWESMVYQIERSIHQSGTISTDSQIHLMNLNTIARRCLNLLTMTVLNNSDLDIAFLGDLNQRLKALHYKTEQLLAIKK